MIGVGTESFTVGELLDGLRAQAVSRLQSAKPNTDLRVIAMTGSGTPSTAQIKGKDFGWWKKTAITGPFAMCYAVAAQTNGKPVNKYQAAGARWGWANSYSTGAKDVALKSKTLSNGSSILKADSVFLSPAYIVFPDEEAAVTQLLKDAYHGWLKCTNPVAQPALAETLLKRLDLTPTATHSDAFDAPPAESSTNGPLEGIGVEKSLVMGSDPEIAGSETLNVGNDESPEIADAFDALEKIGNPRRSFVRRLTAAQNKAIEERAVEVVRAALGKLDYVTKDVGSIESYDVHAVKDGKSIKVEVKGTTTDGSKVYLTANEVELHRAEYPNNALGIVRRIALDMSGDTPVATGGELELTIGWQIDDVRLRPIAYTYTTGL